MFLREIYYLRRGPLVLTRLFTPLEMMLREQPYKKQCVADQDPRDER